MITNTALSGPRPLVVVLSAVTLASGSAPAAGASTMGAAGSCPAQAGAALAPSSGARTAAAQAALAAAAERYKDIDVKGAQVVWSKLARKAGARGAEVASQCGKAILSKTVVVELRFPKELPSASPSEGVVFVSCFENGYSVWEVAH